MAERDKRGGGSKSTTTRKRARETSADRAKLGTVVGGSYRIDEFLGRGAIGAVFGGTHLRLERSVAVKFVDPTLIDDPEIRARFKREAKISSSIQSSHAVEVFDYGLLDDGTPYLVMERLVGEDLHQRLTTEGRIPVSRALQIAKQVCRAIGAAHANGIVHRDLKPENVFIVERDGEREFVKVVDFGLSTFVQSDDTRLTRAGQSVGTPLYMAPEQAGANHFDARVDVYSLGVLIFEMTTGRLPFEAQTLHGLLVALATQPPRTIREYDPRLPQELDDLVLRFIARDPRIRPKTAAAALAEIVALEERLAVKSNDERVRSQVTRAAKAKELAVDGLPRGKLHGGFEDEVAGHLEELRRTGSLATSSLHIGDEDDSPATMREPEPSGGAKTDPIPDTNVRELDAQQMKDFGVQHRAVDLHDTIADSKSMPVVAPSRTPPTAALLPKKAPPSIAKSIEKDESGVFYGQVSPSGSAARLPIDRLHTTPSMRRMPEAPSRRRGPPLVVVWIAIAVFAIVACLVAFKMLGAH